MRKTATVLGVLNLKGGVGKSTISAHIAAMACLDPQWNKPAILDADPQAGSVSWAEAGSRDEPLVVESGAIASADIRKLSRKGVDLIVIDGPPGGLEFTEDAVSVCDFVVIPCKTSGQDLTSASMTIDLCREADVPYVVVINEVRPKSKAANAIIDSLSKIDVPVLAKPIRWREAYTTACRAGYAVFEIEGKEYDAAGAEIEGFYDTIMSLTLEAREATIGK